MEYCYKTRGTCSTAIRIELDDADVIQSVEFQNGCAGNLSGISRLVKGKKAGEIIALLMGTTCGGKPTSCPDQLSKALEEALELKKRTA